MRTWLALILVAFTLTGCAVNRPPNLSPQAQLAFTNTRVIKSLDLLRDTAIAAEAATPPLLSRATTLKVVNYHESAVKIIHATSTGWKATVQTGLVETVKNLPPNERDLLAPYVMLIGSLLTEVN